MLKDKKPQCPCDSCSFCQSAHPSSWREKLADLAKACPFVSGNIQSICGVKLAQLRLIASWGEHDVNSIEVEEMFQLGYNMRTTTSH